MNLLESEKNNMNTITETENTVWTELVSMNTKETLSSYSELISASKQGLTVLVKGDFFNIPKNGFAKVLNAPVELFLSQYELLFHGIIKEIKRKRGNSFEIKISFMDDTPTYYRECLTDLFNFPLTV